MKKKTLVEGLVETARFLIPFFLVVGVQSLTFTPHIFSFSYILYLTQMIQFGNNEHLQSRYEFELQKQN